MSVRQETGGAIADSLAQPVLMATAEGQVVYANAAAEVFFGASEITLMSQSLETAVGFGSPAVALLHTTASRRAPMSEYRMTFDVPRMGKVRIADVFASPHTTVEDRIVLLFQERTMADKMDRQLVSRGAARSVTGLAATLAHEIKNPLSGIRGAAQLLEQSVGKEDVPFARLIRDETDRIVALLDRVTIFGDDRPPDLEPVNIHAVLERVKLLTKTGVAEGIEFIEHYDPSLPSVMGDHDQLIQIFLNLIKNAAEAVSTVANPVIRLMTSFQPGIRVSVPGARSKLSLPLEIIVEDNGPGISGDLLPMMFDPFVTTKSGGSGLGLALVAKLTADQGGVVDVDSEPGRTRFRIMLPMAGDTAMQVEQEREI